MFVNLAIYIYMHLLCVCVYTYIHLYKLLPIEKIRTLCKAMYLRKFRAGARKGLEPQKVRGSFYTTSLGI